MTDKEKAEFLIETLKQIASTPLEVFSPLKALTRVVEKAEEAVQKIEPDWRPDSQKGL
jgi:hypothetical protein